MSDLDNTQPPQPRRRTGAKQVRATQRPVDQRGEQRPFVPRTADNRFDLDERNKVPGMSYQWGVMTCLGQAADEQIITRQYNRWRPVPSYMHPELTGVMSKDDPKANEPILRGGQRLEWREEDLTNQILDMEKERANSQVDTQFKRLKLGDDDGMKKKVAAERKYVPFDNE